MKSIPKKSITIRIIAGVLSLALFCFLSAAQELEDIEREKRIGNIVDEVLMLREGEGAPQAYKDYVALEHKIIRASIQTQSEIRKDREKQKELYRNEDVQEWLRKVDEKQQELRSLRKELMTTIQRRGHNLHERRQAQLRAIAAAQTPNAAKLGFTFFNYPRSDGSTSAQPLGTIIACKVLDFPYHWQPNAPYSGYWFIEGDPLEAKDLTPLHIATGKAIAQDSGSDEFTLVGYRPAAEIPDNNDPGKLRQSVLINRMLVQHAGTHGAYVNIINSHSDIALVAREPSVDETKLADEKGVELVVTPMAFDALVFIKNYENPVENLATQQIRDIYAGKIKNWKDLGGLDHQIHPYRRNPNSGSQELMQNLLMKNTAFEEREHGYSDRLFHRDMGAPYIALTHDEHGLAYSVYYYEHFMAASPNTELVAVDGILPTSDTIQSGEYPYTTQVYAVVRSSSGKQSPEVKLRDWLLTDEGQAVVKESGYVPLR